MNSPVVVTLRGLLLVWLVWNPTPPQAWCLPHQTTQFSPVLDGTELPYRIEWQRVDLVDGPWPTLHSYAKAQWDGKWLLVAGRTNGLHDFTQNGMENFPPSEQNRDLWVIDPQARKAWSRRLDDPAASLTTAQMDELSVTNSQFYQQGSTLYVAGGYGFRTGDDFATFDALSALDVPEVMNWVQGGNGTLVEHLRQVHDPLLRITGGAMLPVGDRTHLVFGQDFQGAYTHFGDGIYSHQVRSFTIEDNGDQLTLSNVVSSPELQDYRRRDLNVVPWMRRNGQGQVEEGLLALSGVFTTSTGVWTVPVVIDAAGTPSMDDPAQPDTFKQAMNGYHSAKLGMYSSQENATHTLLFGGISLFDVNEQGQLVQDDLMPFTNASTAVVMDQSGEFSQFLLPSSFPTIDDPISRRSLRFGANGEFFIADGVPAFPNGLIDRDALADGTTLGYVVGGIVADRPNRGRTAASGEVFALVYRAVPEPSSGGLCLAFWGWIGVARCTLRRRPTCV